MGCLQIVGELEEGAWVGLCVALGESLILKLPDIM